MELSETTRRLGNARDHLVWFIAPGADDALAVAYVLSQMERAIAAIADGRELRMKGRSRPHVAGGRDRAYAYCTGRYSWMPGFAAPYRPAPGTYAAGYRTEAAS